MTPLNEVDCERCQHYRPQTSFVDAYKRFDREPPRVAIMKALLDVRKEETKALESELELLFELLRGDEQGWPDRPRFAPFCAAHGRHFIPAVKNSHGQCGDYAPALDRQGKSCATCEFAVRPETHIGERTGSFASWMDDSARAHQRQVNKDSEDADASAQAVEIEQAFHSDGQLPTVRFLSTCAVRVTGGARHVPPFSNLRQDCDSHRPFLPLPGEAREMVENSRTRESPDALEDTVALAQMVAAAGIERPGAFVDALSDWMKSKPRRRGARLWASACALRRWASEAPPQVAQGASGEALDGGDGQPLAAGRHLVPVVAGCDPYEWGLLAAWSRTSDQAAVASANAIRAQLAEFLVAAVSPYSAALSIESTAALVRAPDLFAPPTLDRIEGFLRRMLTFATELRRVAETDLKGYFEELLGRYSYAVGKWMRRRLVRLDIVRMQAFNPAMAETMRQHADQKADDARRQGDVLLRWCVDLEEGRLAAQARPALLEQLIASNKDALSGDVQDNKQMREGLLDMVRGMLPVDPTMGSSIDNPLFQNHMSQHDETWEESTFALDVAGRNLAGTLLMLRGTAAVTPTALSLLNRKPRLDRAAETMEEALREPTSNTIEALHVLRYKEPPAVVGLLLASYRRIGAPYFRGGAA